MTSYNTLLTARATAASIGLAAVTAANDAALTAALLMAAIDVDSSMRFQGRKYDPAQEREFPRVDGSIIHAWDTDEQAAVAPEYVRIAEVIQANAAMVDPGRSAMLQRMADGISAQTTGSVSVTFAGAAAAGMAPSPLCERAVRMMSRYRLRSGELL